MPVVPNYTYFYTNHNHTNTNRVYIDVCVRRSIGIDSTKRVGLITQLCNFENTQLLSSNKLSCENQNS